MEKVVIFLTILSVFCSLCFSYLCEAATVTVTVTPDKDSGFNENKLPQGFPTVTFDFKVDIQITLEANEPAQYYTISASLVSSNFKGIAANADDSLENDLYFDAEDNGEWSTVTATTLKYEYNSENTTLPKKIKVRCRDWGAHGEVTVSVGAASGKGHIPIDVNDNDIADGWEKQHGIFVADVAAAQAKAGVDDEKGPYARDAGKAMLNNQSPGDGWSVYDEYRGLYTTIDAKGNPTGYIRLKPKLKDVIYTTDASMAKYGVGSLPAEWYGYYSDFATPMHSFISVDEALFDSGPDLDHGPFTEVYNFAADGKATYKADADVNDLVGKVNYNSNPEGGPRVPGAESVYALRIEAETDNKGNPNYGIMAVGSPSKYSLAKVFTGNIKSLIDGQWDNFKNNFNADAKAKAEDNKTNAINVFTDFIISHEVVHGLAGNHCDHLNCIMVESSRTGGEALSFYFYPNGSFYQLKLAVNPNQDPNDPHDDYIVARDANGQEIAFSHPYLSPHHQSGLAVTGRATSGPVSDGPTVTIRFFDEDDADNDEEQGSLPTLSPSNGLYTATAGDSHTAQLSLLSKGASINFYVITPNDAINDVSTYLALASGDGTVTAASADYTFPSGISGDYTFYATIAYTDGTSESSQPSYTVSVNASTSTTPTVTLVPSDGVYTATVGNGHEANFTASQAYTSVYWYLQRPSDTSAVFQRTDTGDGSSTTSQFSYSFPSGVSGDYVFSVTGTVGDTMFSESYTVSVSLPTTTPTVSLPVWSDIPDPYNLTVGDSFSLALSSYVTGSPTITRTGGAIPAGLSLSSGVLSGTVTTVEDRDIRFTATNSAGTAVSEWVTIVVAAAPTVSAPVWSDIPDPYNLTVGQSFSLDLGSYVSGSPTITRIGGAIPAGLSLSNGVLSGTVTTVESRNIRFKATNSAGSANSEWVNIVVSNP